MKSVYAIVKKDFSVFETNQTLKTCKMTQNLQIQLFELRFKNTNELIVSSISQIAIRKEWLLIKEDGYDMSNIIANQTFVAQSEWNNSMISAIEAAK